MELEKLYNLIINSSNEEQTFQENFELWEEFYNNRNYLIRTNITDKKIYTIIKFLLKNEKGTIFDYFQSNLLDKLLFEEQSLTFNLRNNFKIDKNAIATLWNSLENHNDMIEYLNKIKLSEDFITKGSVNKYQNNEFLLDIIEAFIMILHQDFFNIAPEIVHKTAEYIEKEITTIINKETRPNVLHINLIYQYIDKFIPIERYIGKTLEQSTIIKSLIDGKIQDKKLISKLFNTLTNEDILEVFNYDIKKLFEFLDKLPKLDDVYKYSLLLQIDERLLTEENFEFFFPIIIENLDNIHFKRYIDNDKKDKLINYAINSHPGFLDINTITYLLDNGYVNSKFIKNLSELLNSSKFSEEERDLITSKLSKYPQSQRKEYSLQEATNKISNLLENKITIKENESEDIISSIIKELVKNLNLEEVSVYFVNSNNFNGRYSNNNKSIEISSSLIKQLLNQKLSNYERIRVFITLLHEIRHHKQYSENNPFDKEKYKHDKEEYLQIYDQKYYKENYEIVDVEIDARVESYNMLFKFFETFLPNLLDEIQDSIILNLMKEELIKDQRIASNKVTVINKEQIDFNISFDTLIKYNNAILKENPIFLLEYNSNGLPKSYEEIIANLTKENKELVEEILKTRYPDILNQEIKSRHTK